MTTTKQRIWVAALLVLVLASGCTYSSRQEPGSAAGGQDDGAGGPPAAAWQAGDNSQAGTTADKPPAVTVEVARFLRVPTDQVAVTLLRAVTHGYEQQLEVRALVPSEAGEGNQERVHVRVLEDRSQVLMVIWLSRLVGADGHVKLDAAMDTATEFARSRYTGDLDSLVLARAVEQDRGDFAIYDFEWAEADRTSDQGIRGAKVQVSVHGASGRVVKYIQSDPPDRELPANSLGRPEAGAAALRAAQERGWRVLRMDIENAILIRCSPLLPERGPVWLVPMEVMGQHDQGNVGRMEILAIDAVRGTDVTPHEPE